MDKKTQLDQLNQLNQGTMMAQIGIEFTDVGPDFVCARMPVDERTYQPLKMLHGGASVALAETLASVAGTMQVNMETHYCVGMEINANYIRSIREGFVYGKATPIHLGKRTQIWNIRIADENDQLVCISRMTLAVMEK